ncbi:HPr family phosphocarrier protein [Planococcus donghaensis]|uniref:Phosphocarrier protein Chr n=1 Tax=Planococcus donghaensis TaxID=414778 RepID=A0A1C7EJ68_9BACL|nr:HPr family phosphocarrier protein [Planococcus donghaensis]ANU23858.1 phosphocarrier protein Chr [Planococcus donghaensis]
MVEKQVKVLLKTGLQARQAALFVQEANRYSADIYLEKDSKKVNAKSIMGVMSLAISKGTDVKIFADGLDEEKAVDSLSQIMEQEV